MDLRNIPHLAYCVPQVGDTGLLFVGLLPLPRRGQGAALRLRDCRRGTILTRGGRGLEDLADLLADPRGLWAAERGLLELPLRQAHGVDAGLAESRHEVGLQLLEARGHLRLREAEVA